jgi:hypothetical protein
MPERLKILSLAADPNFQENQIMINPISSVRPAEVHQGSQPQASRPAHPPKAPTPKSGEVSQDQVTLKRAGDVDHDGDSK